jgi:lipopolysaccharide export system permease protein
MLTIIDRYILKEIFQTSLAVVIVLSLVVIGRLFVKLLGYVVEGKYAADVVTSLLALGAVKSILLLLPFAVMLSCMLVIGRMYRDSEMHALRAAGYGENSLLRPIMLLAIPLTAFLFYMSMYVSPITILKFETLKEEAKIEADLTMMAPGRFVESMNSSWVIFVEKLGKNNISENIFIQTNSDGHISLETAARGKQRYDKKRDYKYLVLESGQRYTGTPGEHKFQIMDFQKHIIRLDASLPEGIEENPDVFTLPQLLRATDLEAAAEFQWRMFVPISAFLLLLLAVFLSPATPRQGKYSKLVSAIAIYLAYSNLVILSIDKVEDGAIPVNIGAWWVHILLAILILFLYSKQRNFLKFNFLTGR